MNRLKIMASDLNKIFIVCAGLALQSTALAELSLPMKYFEDESVVLPKNGTRVLVGASANMSPSGEVRVDATGQLFVAPTRSTVTGSKFDLYGTANCSVVENEFANERTTSDLLKFNIAEIAKFREDIEFYNLESREARKACTSARKTNSPEVTQLCAYSYEISKAVKDLGEQLKPWTDQIVQLNSLVTQRMEKFGTQLGGFAAATVSLYNPSEITSVQEQNPNHRVSFVPLKDITFSFTAAEEDVKNDALAGLSLRSTLGYSLVGEALPPAQMHGSVGANTAIKNGGNVGLGITLSRLGACNKAMTRAGIFFYKFDSFAYVNGKAMINKWAAFTRLEENSSSQGFFTTSAVHKVYEDLKAGSIHSAIVVGVKEDSLDFQVEKEKLEALVLEDILKDMANGLAIRADTANVLGLPTPGTNGASTISTELQKCPNIYCQVGAFALKGLDAIFGGTSNRAEIKDQYDVKVERQFSYSTKLDDFGGSSALIEWNLN